MLCYLVIKKHQAFRHWCIIMYLCKIEPLILRILQRKEKRYVFEPTVFGDNTPENEKLLEIAFKQRQKQMKEGEIAQTIIGNFIGWKDLGVGHISGLDCLKVDNTAIIELKNKYNTCNSGSQKSILDKLETYKNNNPDTRCIWGIVNPKYKSKLNEKLIHNGVVIDKIQGYELFKFVFKIGGVFYHEEIISFVKRIISSY